MNRKLEILCIGNELLIGKTLNTNAHWLAGHATSLGMTVKRITIIGDCVDEIAAGIHEALRRGPRFIIMTGGLGPTFDDMTLEGIAKALGQRLLVNEEALEMVIGKYEVYFGRKMRKSELTSARVKMATLPEGGKPLPNPVGTAPGILASIKETRIVALPGVPPEMEAIFEKYVSPLLRKTAGRTAFFEKSIHVNGIAESLLAPLIDRAMHDNPRVYVKSHVYSKAQPECEGKRPGIELHLSTSTANAKEAEKRLAKTTRQLADLVKGNSGSISQENNG